MALLEGSLSQQNTNTFIMSAKVWLGNILLSLWLEEEGQLLSVYSQLSGVAC